MNRRFTMLGHRFRTLFRRDHVESDLDRELAFHLERQMEENLASGMTPAEARRRAYLSLGAVEPLKEECRDERRLRWVEEFLQDLRYAFRTLASSRGFTAVAVLSLALGIGANTAIFSFLNTLLLKHLPVPQSERLVRVSRLYTETGMDTNMFNYPFARELGRRSQLFDSVLAGTNLTVDFTVDTSTERVNGELVSGSYFQTLGVGAQLGRTLNPQDDGVEEASPVCMISDRLWSSRFQRDPNILSRAILLNRHPYQIVGVTPPGFAGASLNAQADLQVPMSMTNQLRGNPRDFKGWSWLGVMARLKPGVSLPQAQAELESIGRQLDAEGVTQGPMKAGVDPYRLKPAAQGFDESSTTYGKPARVLMGGVALLLLIACTNLAGLLVARATRRRREIAVRLSLGAGRARVVRQLLTESLVLSLLGGIAGCGFAFFLAQRIEAFLLASNDTLALRLEPDWRVIAFTLGLSLLTGLVFGVVPALEATRPDLTSALKGDVSSRAHRPWTRRSLIVAQVTFSVILLFGAGLLARSLRNLKTVDLGFNAANVLTVSISPDSSGYAEAATREFVDKLLQRLRVLPGIQAASVSSVATLSERMFAAWVSVPGHVRHGEELENYFNSVSPDYFRTLGLPFVAGRDFTSADRKGAPRVAIVNQRFADHYWPGQNPIGRSFKTMGGEHQVVGLVANAKYNSLHQQAPQTVYLSSAQFAMGGVTVQVRTAAHPSLVVGLVREQIRALDPGLPVYEVMTLENRRDNLISQERLLSFLSGLFSGLALLLSATGLYGLVAYSVSSRTREIGVRIAIGAGPRQVVRLFLREAMALAVAGVAVGLPLALASSRLLKSLLYNLPATDPVALVGAALLLIAATAFAAWMPARRATRVDPASALRVD